MEKANMDVRKAIEDSGLKYWQIADAIGVNDGNFSRMLRTELSQEKKKQIYDAILSIK